MISVIKKENCCGCQACENVCPKHCISMVQDFEGFYYPKVDSSLCVNCRLCEKVCPIQNKDDVTSPKKTYAAMNPEELVRLNSSSGGIFSALAKHVLNGGGVVFGALYDEKWQVIIDCVESIEELTLLQGSKYVQSQTKDSFRKCEHFLKNGRTVLYSGTPCQIAGLKHFLRKDYENLFTCDVVCHGSPSPGVWKKYLEEKVGDLNLLRDIKFREKGNGWRKFNFVLKSQSYELKEFHKENLYMKAFLSNMILRPSCYKCGAKEGRCHSDFTLADFWKIERVFPQIDDNKGTSLVMVNSSKGLSLFELLNLVKEEVSYDEAFQYNTGLKAHAEKHPNREKFFSKLNVCENLEKLICRYVEFPRWFVLKKKVLSRLKRMRF